MMAQREQRRWYDKDPLLSMAMKILEESADAEQLRLAMHVVKIINEHNIDVAADGVNGSTGDDASLVSLTAHNGRWYDFDQTLQASIEALRCSDGDTQKIIAREIAQMLNEVMNDDENGGRA